MTDSTADTRNSHIRFWIVATLFIVSAINYAERATLSYTGSQMSDELGITTIQLGYIFSAFGWSYVAGQIPGEVLLIVLTVIMAASALWVVNRRRPALVLRSTSSSRPGS